VRNAYETYTDYHDIEFTITSEVGPAFFERMQAARTWHLNFDEYYDVCIWDNSPGNPMQVLGMTIEEVTYPHC
jgi:hypothetical protein